MELKQTWEMLEKKHPLVHCITNYVTVNDVANILLASGGSPIMSDDCGDVEDITSICGGLCINIGTLNQHTIPAMLLAGKKANALGHVVLLDPVGAGASALRTETALQLLREVKFDIIRGNISEMKALALGTGTTQGVDAAVGDALQAQNRNQVIAFAKQFAQDTGAIIVITGATDLITDGKDVVLIHNGHPMLSKITGSGCMLSALLTACAVANPMQQMEAMVAGVCAMGYCGEIAQRKTEVEQTGTSSFRMYLIDAISLLTGKALEEGAKYDVISEE